MADNVAIKDANNVTVTVRSKDVGGGQEAQYIIDLPASSFMAAVPNVITTASRLDASHPTARMRVRIQNFGPNRVYIGHDGNIATTGTGRGFLLGVNGDMVRSWDENIQVWACSEGSSDLFVEQEA